MPWMKYLKASVSLPGCTENRTDAIRLLLNGFPYHFFFNIDVPFLILQTAYYLDATAAMSRCFSGLQPDDCGPRLFLLNALKCHLLTLFTLPTWITVPIIRLHQGHPAELMSQSQIYTPGRLGACHRNQPSGDIKNRAQKLTIAVATVTETWHCSACKMHHLNALSLPSKDLCI